jgi:hypothetical protein
MPRPQRGVDLIVLQAGAFDFRRGDWWSTYKEGRLFLPRGFPEAMAKLDLNSVEPLVRLTEQASKNIVQDTQWTRQLPARNHWSDCSRAQLVMAAEEKPLLLCKAAVAMEALQLFADQEGRTFDAYAEVKLLPASYKLEGWTVDIYTAEKQANTEAYQLFKVRAVELFQNRPDLLLHDFAKGLHGTFELIKLAKDTFNKYELEIVGAHRPGQAGIAPASD